VTCASQLSPSFIKQILRRENQLRLSAEVREKLLVPTVRDVPDGWLGVMESLQQQVASEFGLPEAVGLAAMRQAEQLLPGDPEVRELSLYRKYNRCINGNLAVGDVAPNPTVHHPQTGAPLHLLDLLQCSTSSSLVIFAGSIT